MSLFRAIARTIKWGFVALIVFGGILLAGLPNMGSLRDHNPVTTSFIERYVDEIHDQGKTPDIDHTWINLKAMSPELKKAVLIAEDDTFYKHHGFNWKEIKKAALYNWRKKSYVRGASTITQQLVKNLYLAPTKNIYRKLKELILTYQMEKTLPKDRILELYLNLVEWGPGIYGAEAASEHYFKKSATTLGSGEAAYLAAILPNPEKLSLPAYSRYAHRRQGMILGRMNRGYVTIKDDKKPTTVDEVDDLPEEIIPEW